MKRYEPKYNIIIESMDPGKRATGTIDGVKFVSRLRYNNKGRYVWEHYFYEEVDNERGKCNALSINLNACERELALAKVGHE